MQIPEKKFRYLISGMPPSDRCYRICLLTLIFIFQPLVYAFLLTTKVTLQNNGSIKTLMVANSSWPQECNERPEFRTVTSSHRDNLRNGTLHYRPEFAMNEINFDDE